MEELKQLMCRIEDFVSLEQMVHEQLLCGRTNSHTPSSPPEHKSSDGEKLFAELKDFPVTIALLKETGAGKILVRHTKIAKSGRFVDLANEVQSTWKQHLLSGSVSLKRSRDEEGDVDSNVQQKKRREDSSVKTDEVPDEEDREKPIILIDTTNIIASFTPTTDVKQRNTVQTKLLEALCVEAEEIKGAIPFSELAIAIEAALFKDNGDSIVNQYAAKFRLLSSNIKDPLNTILRYRIRTGDIAPEYLVSMSYEELANPEIQGSRKKMEEWMTAARRDDVYKPTQTSDMFQCKKCKERKTTFYQLQTRSSDEPMTTFVTCEGLELRQTYYCFSHYFLLADN